MTILVVDVGGTHVKLRTQKQAQPVRFKSGSKMTPQRMMAQILEATRDWKFDCVTVG